MFVHLNAVTNHTFNKKFSLRLNAANHATLHFLRRYLSKISSNEPNADKNYKSVMLHDNEVVQSELAFTFELGGENPKNYQI